MMPLSSHEVYDLRKRQGEIEKHRFDPQRELYVFALQSFDNHGRWACVKVRWGGTNPGVSAPGGGQVRCHIRKSKNLQQIRRDDDFKK